MHDEARQQGVKVVNLGDFLNYMGWKPRPRLFRPGDKRPWTLKAGSHSGSAGESVTHREGTGTVSEVYKGDKKAARQIIHWDCQPAL